MLGMSRGTLAKAVKVTRPTIWSWEMGHTSPDASYLPALAAVLGKPVEWFFGGALKEAPLAKS
jgi:transcriptional regulator with XRE-family HTH domain